MNSRECGLLAATSILAALAIPAALDAQINGDAQLTILQTTDLHHHANGADHVGLDVDRTTGMSTTGAYARISAYVSYVRASAGHPVILVDSGDWTMGTFYDLTLASRPLALSFLDLLHYDCVTPGNHEFDYTPKGLAQILGAAQSSFAFRTPIVASNMNLGGNADLAPFVGEGKAIQSTRVQVLPNGLKVGYLGLMGKSAGRDAPASAPVSFADFSTRYAAIQDLVDGLRNTQGVHVVVVLSHSGTDPSGNAGEDVERAGHVRGIDVIASGHTHTPLASAHAVTNGDWSTQIIDAGAFGTNVSRIDLTYHSSSKSTTLDASSSPAMTDASLAAALSAADTAGLLANRINAAPAGAGVQELKEWMALLSYVGTGLRGAIASAYASSADFTQFAGFGAAVQARNATYPIASIGQLLGTLGGLQGAPPCTSIAIPVVAAVTNESYGSRLSATGTAIVWGSGFFAGGGNSVRFTRAESADAVALDISSGQYFWDLSAIQINTALPGRITPGQWMVSVKNACGATSAGFAVTIQ